MSRCTVTCHDAGHMSRCTVTCHDARSHITMHGHMDVKFIRVFFTRRNSACSWLSVVTLSPLWPPVNKNTLWSFRHTSIGQLFMFVHGCGLEASPTWVRRQFLAEVRASKLKGNTDRWQIGVTCWWISSRVGHKYLMVNIEFTGIKITEVINLKWHNPGYPCYPLCIPHLTFAVITKRYIPWVELVFTTARIGRL